MKPKSLSIGINYWLKDKLLTETEIGEYAQFWLGAYTEVNFDWNKTHNLCNIFSRRDTMKVILAPGCGLTRIPQLSGLTGLMVSLTTTMARTVL